MPFMLGLLQGFQAARDAAAKDNYEKEVQNRQFADRVFGHLLTSDDEGMRDLALKGMMEPITGAKKGGFAGYLGKYREENPNLTAAMARADEMIPDTSSAPAGPASPGSAAMSTMNPGEYGPIAQPGTPPPEAPPAAVGGAAAAQPANPLAQVPEPPAAPPAVQGWTPPQIQPPMAQPPAAPPLRRRGTMVPQAEDIAVRTKQRQTEQAIRNIRQYITDPAEQQRAIENVLSPGAPTSGKNLVPVPYGMKDPVSGVVEPALLDVYGGGVVRSDGKTHFPPGWQQIPFSGGGGGAGLSSTAASTPQLIANLERQLRAQGADEDEIEVLHIGAPYFRIQQRADHTIRVLPAQSPERFTYGTEADASGAAATVSRSNLHPDTGTVVGAPQQTQADDTQNQAIAFRDAVLAAIKAKEDNSKDLLGRITRLDTAARDALTLEMAKANGLPYQTFQEVDQRANARPKAAVRPGVTPAAAPGAAKPGPDLDAIRARGVVLDQQLRGGAPQQGTPPPAGPPPSAPSALRKEQF